MRCATPSPPASGSGSDSSIPPYISGRTAVPSRYSQHLTFTGARRRTSSLTPERWLMAAAFKRRAGCVVTTMAWLASMSSIGGQAQDQRPPDDTAAVGAQQAPDPSDQDIEKDDPTGRLEWQRERGASSRRRSGRARFGRARTIRTRRTRAGRSGSASARERPTTSRTAASPATYATAVARAPSCRTRRTPTSSTS